jgi:hypothetical protein
MYKNAALLLYCCVISFVFGNHIRNRLKSKYITKKKVKMPEFTVWNVPDEPRIINFE